MNYSEKYINSRDGLRLYYRDYPNASSKIPVLCLPGVTRNSRDFDAIAPHIARDRRVLTMDMRGRGRSAYDPHPENYLVPVETTDVFEMLQQAGVANVIVLGTSRGGIIAMAMATARPGLIKGAILNDIGPEIEPEGLAKIAAHVGSEPAYENWAAVAAGAKRANKGIITGLPEAQWEAFARARFREDGDKIVVDYDPNLVQAFKARAAIRVSSADLWALFNALAPVPVLVLRGENSTLLSVQGLTKMHAVKPDLMSVTVKGRGHVPFLDEPEALAAIDDFLVRFG